MYVKKEDLRAAVVARIAELSSSEQVKTSQELYGEKQKLIDAFTVERSQLFRELLTADPTLLSEFRADPYSNRRFTGQVNLTPELQTLFDERNKAIDDLEAQVRVAAARERALYQRRGRRADPPASVFELEAWMARIDNDIKTATVNIKRDFAIELGLIDPELYN